MCQWMAGFSPSSPPPPRDLRFHVPGRPRTDMAVHAGYAGVGRSLVGRVLGLHDRVAELPAERGGLRIEEGVVRNEGQEDREEGAPDHREAELLPYRGVVQVELGVGQGLVDAGGAPGAALPPA